MNGADIFDYAGNVIAVTNKFEPARNDIPIVTITGTLYETKSQGNANVVIEYKSSTLEFTSYAKAKVQGDSSQHYPKKNYTITLFSDTGRQVKDKRQFRDWDKPRNKFVLKANWIDHSHARNVVNARLWTQIVKSRSDYDTLPYQLRNGNKAVDGFPVKVYNNGVYMGLYTWNLPKDSLYGLDDDLDENCIIQSEGGMDNLSLLFRSPAIDGKWSDEFHDTMPSTIETAWTSILQFVSQSSDTEFVNNFETHFDKMSMIDEHIFFQLACVVDNVCKNQTFFTYDAQKWFTGAYDLDATWGQRPFLPDTSTFEWLSPELVFLDEFWNQSLDGVYYGNKRHMRLTEFFMTDIESRYSELRSSVLSEDNINSEFDKFMDVIPPYLYAEDYAETTGNGQFTGIPNVSSNNILQIRAFVIDRLAYVDENLK